ncbi:hypothetical protein NC652_013925 [Populus alba x Populus x berolinensis]|nr:hypothetical protein NC652_013925 [Populus alba x Populus x berolinensis]
MRIRRKSISEISYNGASFSSIADIKEAAVSFLFFLHYFSSRVSKGHPWMCSVIKSFVGRGQIGLKRRCQWKN